VSAERERAPRLHVGCDQCDAGGWIGPRGGGVDAWCEACQRPAWIAADANTAGLPPCPACGAPLSAESLRSEELYGEIQHLAAVVEAWRGNPAPLAALLPERPRFITDLTPPAPRADDDPATAAALAALAAGAFANARVRLEGVLRDARAAVRPWHAVAIAYERLGEPGFAERAWTQVLEREEQPVARLARGALRARRGEFMGARADLERAGPGFEARWNRAALEAVSRTPGLPEAGTLARARAEAGEISPYWSNPSVGRLLWTLLVERSNARAARGAPACPDERVLRAAEHELEHDTFWDQALIVHGYAALGLAADAARTAAALALDMARTLASEPSLGGPAARPIAEGAKVAWNAVGAGDPVAALAALDRLMGREDLRRYRMPCGHCGRGTIGVDQAGEEPEA